jgi:hypothetical protein
MPEGLNIEVAQHLTEKEDEEGEEHKGSLELLEIVEALLLAVVTIATAWSGYQAARWDGRNALLYGEASKQRLFASRESTLSGQYLLYNASTFNAWGAAKIAGDSKLEAFYVKRFTSDFRVAFNAWVKTNPGTNPKAPPGPSYMPQYHNLPAAKSAAYDAEATRTFQEGSDARDTADKYVRTTVFLASILFLIALAQRFKFKLVRRTLLGVSGVLLIYALYTLVTYPIA